jgi:L-seryl-tRNA(Ser) seleniumtransferase
MARAALAAKLNPSHCWSSLALLLPARPGDDRDCTSVHLAAASPLLPRYPGTTQHAFAPGPSAHPLHRTLYLAADKSQLIAPIGDTFSAGIDRARHIAADFQRQCIGDSPVKRRDIPSVDRLLQEAEQEQIIALYGRDLVAQAIRIELADLRSRLQSEEKLADKGPILTDVQARLERWLAPSLVPVINATGVIIHTNLGRAPLSDAAVRAMNSVASGYSTLEYDLEHGERGKRDQHAETLLTRLTGAQAALVVNNNAAAVLLALTALATNREVIISRSQLIEIGGGFRVPDVMKQSGAHLVEVGTTNRTHLKDYESAINDRTALILRAHHSNFRIVGFTTEPSLEELVALGKTHKLPVLDDIGSGALYDTTQFGLGHEPIVQDSLQNGASLVAFSGDKLLGGPQAGILVGQQAIVDQLRQYPLARALRPDKLCLAALAATLRHHLRGEAFEEVPVWRMIAAEQDEIKRRAEAWREILGFGEVVPARSTVGGGSLPEETLPTYVLSLEVEKPNEFAARLRGLEPPVIARVHDERVLLDPRTVLLRDERALLDGVQSLLN